VLLCAPSMGVLDNWLPVLHAVRAEHPEWRIVALIPDRDTLAQLDPADTAHVLADEVIDETVAPLVDGGWVAARGFLGAAELAQPSFVARALMGLAGRSARRAGLSRTGAQRRAATALSALAAPGSRLLYDVHLHEKERLSGILDVFADAPRFSVNHGIDLEVDDPSRCPPTDPENVWAAHLYGAGEVDAYARNFGLDPDSLHVVGIARHTRAWVERVVAASASRHHLPHDGFVFVVSRPAGSPYLPRDRKVAALRALHQVAWQEHGIPLVLRTHPKESEDGTLADALPADEQGISWSMSRAHPFHLARHSRLAVTLFSGVSIDLVAMGVPVIELLDVRGLAGFDGPGSARDGRGRPLFGPYRQNGLVIPADDIDDLRMAFTRVLEDRTGELEMLESAHRSVFAPPDRAIPRIVADLVAPTKLPPEDVSA
jgi:hypothetical protein